MTVLTFVLFAVAGGVGAAVRFVCDGLIRTHLKTAFPWATTMINVSGSLALGILLGFALAQFPLHELTVVIATGFLGGYTTFSTASYESVQLLKQGRYMASFVSGFGMLVLAVAAAVLGLWIGTSFS